MSIVDHINLVERDAVFGEMDSRLAGLTETEARARLAAVGYNQFESEPKGRLWRALLKHSANFFSILLYISSAISFVADRIQPGEGMGLFGWALLVVAILNTLFAFGQEMRAERAMEELRKFLPAVAHVRRDSRQRLLPASELVPGDIVLLSEGDRVPADARLIESEELLVNNAPLTGESRSVPLTDTPEKGRLLDSANIAFAGCSVLRGSGVGVVFGTGYNTEFGKIAAMSREVERPASPIERETNRMIRILTVIAVTMGILFFAYGVATGRSLWINVVFMLGIIVANVPEGLLPTFTLALSMASLRMARKNVLVKTLDAVESLGAVHVICTDKTGTLTKNELTITQIIDPVQGNVMVGSHDVPSLLKSALIASEVHGESNELYGDPLDVAVAACYGDSVGAIPEIIAGTRRHFPFDLQKRREAGLFASESEIQFAIKGAWESLRPLVGSIRSPGSTDIDSDIESLRRCDEIVTRISTTGRRVIAVASRRLNDLPAPAAVEESLERSMKLLGFLVLDDPIRPEVPDAMARCHHAGINVILITGDHPATARAVARQCGILKPDGSEDNLVVSGAELGSLGGEQLAERLRDGAKVFSRTTPEQKMKIVTALKRLGHVVAMTGDGVNDAPALKAADVGIAMGISGTDVARESADIVLLDDNFASIVAGVEEGRAVFTNMRKFTTYVLASNVPEIVPLLIYVILPVPLALTVIQILSIDLGTDLLPALGLGQEPPEHDTMQCPPRRSDERLLSFPLMGTAYLFLGVIQAAWSLAMFFMVLIQGGWRWGQELASNDPLYQSATGITLATVVLMQIGNVVGRRSLRFSGLDLGFFRNRLILAGIAVEIVFSWAVLYFPPVQKLLGTGAVAGHLYAIAWLGIPILFALDFLRKRFLIRSQTT
jgi:sodium/potassium-transporting ATPase subunit alpha